MTFNESVKRISGFTRLVLSDPSPDLVASHLAIDVLESIDCRGIILCSVKKEGFLEIIASYGFNNDVMEPFSRIPLWTPLPVTDCVKRKEILIFESPSELVGAYPNLSQFYSEDPAVTIAAPIIFQGAAIGCLGITSVKMPRSKFKTSVETATMLDLCAIFMKGFQAKLNHTLDRPRRNTNELSSRQRKIIGLFVDNLTIEEMAESLKYSTSTIKQDIIRLYDIFGVNTRSEVVDLARRAGLINLDTDKMA